MKGFKLTLRNDFHNTEATVIVKDGIITHSSLKRARKKLCGVKECKCGEIRGPQEMMIDTRWDHNGEFARIFEK